ncbi:MAG: carbohydrate kinase [Oscillospiraceae bacterium]|nr:carbohydrate kinase [Oscillospiraceae bacterium]MBR6425517.1 carbohydrate kinase [Oscillospiraceae bacterium]
MEKKTFDVVALGELLIDFTQNGLSGQGNPLFEANPGGAPCNVLAMLQKLGRKTAFIGKVGKDGFGDQLRKTVLEAGINVDHLLTDDSVHTTLAIVHTKPGGDRDFSFYRNPGADMMLTEQELPRELPTHCGIFHFGTLSMTHPGVRMATKTAVGIAKEAGALISFDPNLRPPLWPDLEVARQQMEWGFGVCDILKIADNELEFFTGETDFDRGASRMQRQFPNIRLLNVTAGAEGSYSYCCGQRVFVPAFRLGGTIETTGAGDTFCACVLHDVLAKGLENRSADSLREMLRFANAAAYLVTTKKGAIRSMPELEQVYALLKENP